MDQSLYLNSHTAADGNNHYEEGQQDEATHHHAPPNTKEGSKKKNKKATTNTNNKRSSCGELLTTLLLLTQTLVLLLVLGLAVHLYTIVDSRTEKITNVVAVLENPSASPKLIRAASEFLKSTSHAFFLGDSDGSVAVFVETLMSYDFATLAKSVSSLGSAVETAFMDSTPNPMCYQPVSCPNQWERFRCPNGRETWCPYNQQVNCAPVQDCIGYDIMSASSIAQSVASKLTSWVPVQSSAGNATAAFSNGVFRLDKVLDWVHTQTAGSEEWKSAGEQCQDFISQVRNVSWTGQYYTTSGKSRSWDANREVKQAADYVEMVCDGLSNLAPTSTTASANGASSSSSAASKNNRKEKKKVTYRTLLAMEAAQGKEAEEKHKKQMQHGGKK